MVGETMQKNEAEALVTALFQGILKCPPDQPGFDQYVDALLSGTATIDIVNLLISNPKFGSHLFVPPGHYYSPIVNPDDIDEYVERYPAYRAGDTLPGIHMDREKFVHMWELLLPYLSSIPFTEAELAPYRYRFDNPAFSWGDGSILHAMIRHFKPKRMVEIGSGWSSACTLDTIDHYLGGACQFKMIDPYADLVRSLVDPARENIQILEEPIQKISTSIFQELRRNDILFIDSTHVAKSGSDVCREFFDILPNLNSGVVVHVHDIFWPFEYPDFWVIDQNRSWNEIYILRAFLTNNLDWDILMMNDYMGIHESDRIQTTYPDFMKNPGGSFWMQKR